jgi:glycosyltransferase involved in cell wall biosynthesis
MHPELSIVIPLYNEAESFSQLLSELIPVLNSLKREYEIVPVDDGSTDGTSDLIREAASRDPHIRGIFLRSNTKKCGALREGIVRAAGSIIVTLDGDLQDDPSEIPNLLREMDAGADVVIGWKKDRKDGIGKRIPSRIINFVCSRSLHVRLHDMNSGLKAMTKEAALSAPLFDSLYRYMAHFLAAEGYSVREIAVRHRPRKHGRTKFGILHRLQGIEDFFLVLLLVGLRKRRHVLLFLIATCLVAGLAGLSLVIASAAQSRGEGSIPLILAAVASSVLVASGLRIAIVYCVYRQRLSAMKGPLS